MADSHAFLFPAVPDLFFGSYKKPNAAGSQMGGQNSADDRHQYRHTGITLSHFSVKIFGIFFRAFMGNADSFKLSVRRRNFKHCVKHLAAGTAFGRYNKFAFLIQSYYRAYAQKASEQRANSTYAPALLQIFQRIYRKTGFRACNG